VRSLPALLSYADKGPSAVGAWPATYAAVITLVVGTTVGLALASLESWVDVSRRMRFWFGLVTVGAAAAGVALAATRLPSDTPTTAATWWTTTAHPHTWARDLTQLPTTVLAVALACGVGGILWQRSAAILRGLAASRRARARPDAPLARELRPDGAWAISLLAAIAFWGMHAALDSSWALPPDALPAVLLFAIAVAEVDAHAHVLWPGWSGRVRRMGVRLWGPLPVTHTADPERRSRAAESHVPTGLSADAPFTTHRRADQYTGRRRRRARRAATLRPPGPLSAAHRWLVMIVSTIGTVGLAWVYLTLG
jgi:hypothetical protein